VVTNQPASGGDAADLESGSGILNSYSAGAGNRKELLAPTVDARPADRLNRGTNGRVRERPVTGPGDGDRRPKGRAKAVKQANARGSD
jgi:hypothetical protein